MIQLAPFCLVLGFDLLQLNAKASHFLVPVAVRVQKIGDAIDDIVQRRFRLGVVVLLVMLSLLFGSSPSIGICVSLPVLGISRRFLSGQSVLAFLAPMSMPAASFFDQVILNYNEKRATPNLDLQRTIPRADRR